MPELKPSALLVEDEKQIRRFVRTALEGVGWAVHEAETMAAGLSAASTRNPDLVILDLGLPDGDGMELLRDLRTPFGGSKQSGVGREGGVEALRFFTEPRNICIRY